MGGSSRSPHAGDLGSDVHGRSELGVELNRLSRDEALFGSAIEVLRAS